jgi:hypothetical protein
MVVPVFCPWLLTTGAGADDGGLSVALVSCFFRSAACARLVSDWLCAAEGELMEVLEEVGLTLMAISLHGTFTRYRRRQRIARVCP